MITKNGSDKDDSHDRNLNDEGIYLFMGSVDDDSCSSAIEFILEQNLKQKPLSELKLFITSYGGYTSSCFALIDIMKGSKIPVHTIGLGTIASCGLLIFMSGEKGHRVLTPNTKLLSHQFSGGDWGKEHELLAGVKGTAMESIRMIEHYKKCTNLKSEKDIRKYLLPPEDVWLTPAEGKKFGIADAVKKMY